MDYAEFIKGKVTFDSSHGHGVNLADINPLLKPHQRDIVQERQSDAVIVRGDRMTGTYEDVCRIHQVMHCIDCGYIWHDSDGYYVPGTGDWYGVCQRHGVLPCIECGVGHGKD